MALHAPSPTGAAEAKPLPPGRLRAGPAGGGRDSEGSASGAEVGPGRFSGASAAAVSSSSQATPDAVAEDVEVRSRSTAT
ncbi:hypothetical protein GCM10020256_37530 [Streptomyces thermocoprophilus]